MYTTKDNRWLVLGLIVTMLLLAVCSCGKKNIAEDDAISKAESYLNAKYEKQFKASIAEEKEGEQDIEEYLYVLQANEEGKSEDIFTVYVSHDGSHITDNYGSVQFGDDVTKDLSQIIITYRDIIKSSDLRYICTEGTWSDLEEYKKDHNIRITMDVGSEYMKKKELKTQAYDLMKALDKQNYDFVITMSYDGKTHVFTRDSTYPMPTKEAYEAELKQ